MTNNFFEVLRTGINSTFQDIGRENYCHIGLPLGGAMDRRNYLICILYYKFKCSEEYIASNLNVKRCSVTHAKRQPIYLVKSGDPLFQKNVLELQKKYPYELPKTDAPLFVALARAAK